MIHRILLVLGVGFCFSVLQIFIQLIIMELQDQKKKQNLRLDGQLELILKDKSCYNNVSDPG